jgi:hypothetical protein
MHVISARNVQIALPKGMEFLRKKGLSRQSRNGEVLVAPGPVTTHYHRPLERVLFWAARDANPFFHFMEALWMLAGRNDTAFLTRYVKRMDTFSDDGVTLHGAYGHRWLNHFDMEGGGHSFLPNQLAVIIDRLIRFPDDRRCVLTMWDPVADLGANTKDQPCNTHIYFSRNQHGHLDMTVCCRSNDLIWGCCGANAVHFSVLQEYLAHAIGCKIGQYWQISNNYHAYIDVFVPLEQKLLPIDPMLHEFNPYAFEVKPYPLIHTNLTSWWEDLNKFIDIGYGTTFVDKFFPRVACPLAAAHDAVKQKCFDDALKILDNCWALDWQMAAKQWVERRKTKFNREKDDGPTY